MEKINMEKINMEKINMEKINIEKDKEDSLFFLMIKISS
jgi:hypothetical protein